MRAAEEEFDPDTVTPGIWGFVLTFLVMVVVVLLVLDMVRRIRRVNYRAEVREQLEAEQRRAGGAGRSRATTPHRMPRRTPGRDHRRPAAPTTASAAAASDDDEDQPPAR